MLKSWFMPSRGQQQQVATRLLLLCGLLLAIYGSFKIYDTVLFVFTAETAEGEVTSLDERGWPVITFTSADGMSVMFIQPPTIFLSDRYSKAEKLALYYDPATPTLAKIKGFKSLWLTALQACVGGIFLLWICYAKFHRNELPRLLAAYGVRVEAGNCRVSTTISFSEKGRVWYIHADYTDEKTGKRLQFKSAPVPFDISRHVLPEKVTVFYMPRRSFLHVMDIQFLDETAPSDAA